MLTLKESTASLHKLAEQMPFNQRMFRGELSQMEYLRYLYQQLEIFKAIEARQVLPCEELARVPAISEDIKELETGNFQVEEIKNATLIYTNYLIDLSDESLKPHIYLNYMALLFGGQIIKSKVPSKGLMYDFANQKDCVQSIRRIQKDDWSEEVNRGYDFLINIFKELEASN